MPPTGLFFCPKMIQKRYIHDIVDVSLFLYSLGMNTDFLIRLMMCGYTRFEAIMIADEYEDDEQDLLEARIEAMEEEKRQERVRRIQSITIPQKSG